MFLFWRKKRMFLEKGKEKKERHKILHCLLLTFFSLFNSSPLAASAGKLLRSCHSRHLGSSREPRRGAWIVMT